MIPIQRPDIKWYALLKIQSIGQMVTQCKTHKNREDSFKSHFYALFCKLTHIWYSGMCILPCEDGAGTGF